MARLTEHWFSAAPSVGAASTSRRRHLVGRPSNNRHTPENFARRFWAKVDRRGDDECWPWLGGKLKTGRGQVHLRYEGTKSVRKMAPAVAWELTYGAIPEGFVTCHRCDSPICCNVAHLFLGTQAENVHDCIHKGRRNAFGVQKLHIPDVLEIRRLATLGLTHAAIGARFGVARNTVCQIVNRVTWGWLTETGLHAVKPLGQARADFDQLTEQGRRAEVFGA